MKAAVGHAAYSLVWPLHLCTNISISLAIMCPRETCSRHYSPYIALSAENVAHANIHRRKSSKFLSNRRQAIASHNICFACISLLTGPNAYIECYQISNESTDYLTLQSQRPIGGSRLSVVSLLHYYTPFTVNNSQ